MKMISLFSVADGDVVDAPAVAKVLPLSVWRVVHVLPLALRTRTDKES